MMQKIKKILHSTPYQIVLHVFACVGLAILAAWGLYKLGLTNNRGAVDKNNRYLADYKQKVVDSSDYFITDMQNFVNIAVLSKIYPKNAQLIYEALRTAESPAVADRMMYAAGMYLKSDSAGRNYTQIVSEVQALLAQYPTSHTHQNLIPWMNDSGWVTLKRALIKDKDVIRQAAEITGVDARLIAGCTVGEQIRLFNSKREDLKRYLGPATMNVQSQFSYGVNGIKDFTAARVERNLRNPNSVFYMGKKYEHILDYPEGTLDTAAARFDRLIDYRNHLYSYIYTGCILHQTMLQWKRAGYDISNRPDVLFTLFNLGFGASKPNPEPKCGGSHVSVHGVTYTFGVLGNDFFYSGELSNEFPMHETLFAESH